MADILTSITGVVIGLGLMVLVHELGHFVVAKAFGVRVDVFSLGFGPRLWGWRRGVTDYRVSALPIGGYVKMAGDNPMEQRAGEPDEFLSKTRWQRTLIALAGPAANILIAVIMIAGLLVAGKAQPVYVDRPVDVAWVAKDSPSEKAGIRPGDRIVQFRGKANPTWEGVLFELLFASPNSSIPVTIERDGQMISTAVQPSADEFAVVGYPEEPALVGSVTRNKPAERSGIQPGDRVIRLEQQPVVSPFQVGSLIQQRNGQPTNLEIQRGDRTLHVTLRPAWDDPGDALGARWQIGVSWRFVTEKHSYSLAGAVERSVWFNTRITEQILHVVSQLFQGRMSLKQVQGPLGIVRESGRAARRGPADLISVMALISLNLGILNLLPIPILDGGHILLMAIEGTLRRDLSVRVKERFVQAGLVFLLVIFAIVMYNDVLRMLPSH